MSKYRVFKSQYGEFVVDSVDESSGFVASFDGKNWVPGLIFGPYALQELLLVSDQTEAKAIVDAAKRHLSQKPAVTPA
jgi:hypothetical protein